MKLSVIIPCYNAVDTITAQLEALAGQQWSEPWEVIVVDNGSTDETLAIVGRYTERLPGLCIIDASDRPGAGHARNVGVQAATGDLLAFCDADDEVAPGWVAAIGNALHHYDFVASRFDCGKLNETWTLKVRGCPQQDGLQAYKYPPYLPHAGGCGLGVKRSIHEAVDGFDETMLRLQDTDYCWRIQLAGTEPHFVPEAVVHIRHRHTLVGTYRQARNWGEDNVRLYKKYRALGMPDLPWQGGLKAWLQLLWRLPRLRHREGRIRWLRQFYYRLGRIQGSLKYRVWAL